MKNVAFFMKGKTIHSLFPIPIGPAQYKPMKPPRADRLMRLQQELKGLTCLCLDERSMVGSVVFGWLEFMLRMGMNKWLYWAEEEFQVGTRGFSVYRVEVC